MDMQIKLRYINEISGGALFNEGSRMRSEAAVGVHPEQDGSEGDFTGTFDHWLKLNSAQIQTASFYGTTSTENVPLFTVDWGEVHRLHILPHSQWWNHLLD